MNTTAYNIDHGLTNMLHSTYYLLKGSTRCYIRRKVSGIEEDHERIERDTCAGNIIKHVYSCSLDEVQQLHTLSETLKTLLSRDLC